MSASSMIPFLDPSLKISHEHVRLPDNAGASSVEKKPHKPSEIDKLLYSLQSENAYYKDSESASLTLYQDPSKSFAVWKRPILDCDPKIFGIFLRPPGTTRKVYYTATEEELSDIARCHRTLKALGPCIAEDYQTAVELLRNDAKKTIAVWLEKEIPNENFYVIRRIDASDNPYFKASGKISFTDFSPIIADHFKGLQARARLQQDASLEAELFSRIKLYKDRAHAFKALQKNPSLTFAVWKRVTDEAQKYGLYLSLTPGNPNPPYKLTAEQLIKDVESAEVIQSLQSQGAFASDHVAAKKILQNNPDSTLVSWASFKNNARIFHLLTRDPNDQTDTLKLIEDINLRDFATKVRDHYAKISFTQCLTKSKTAPSSIGLKLK